MFVGPLDFHIEHMIDTTEHARTDFIALKGVMDYREFSSHVAALEDMQLQIQELSVDILSDRALTEEINTHPELLDDGEMFQIQAALLREAYEERRANIIASHEERLA